MTAWIRRYAAGHAKLVRPELAKVEKNDERPAAKIDADAFSRLLIGSEVARKYGAFLEQNVEQLDAVASAARSMEPFRARQFTRTIEGFYKSLGETLSKTPAAERPSVASASIGAMAELVDRIGSNERLMPAIAALASLLERRGAHAPNDLAKNAPEALSAVLDFAAAQEGKSGGHTAIHLSRNLIEVLERRTKELTASDRPELWREVGAFIDRASPVSGMQQKHAADLGVWVLDALARGADWRAALVEAEAKATDQWAAAQSAAIEGVTNAPLAIAAGTPARAAMDELAGALAELLRQNPAGDEGLHHSAENLIARLGQHQGAITDQSLPIVRDLAAICLAGARWPAAAKILDHFAAQIPGILGLPADVLAPARGRNAGGVALALIDAGAAIGGADQAQLAQAKDALDELSPALAARSALALLPYLQSLETALPLARALAERAEHAADHEELDRFAQKLAAAHPTLRALLGDDAGPIASELARGYGPALPAAEVTKIGQLALAVKGALPAVPLDRLIAQDGAGRPGLSDLRGELRHDPLPLLTSLLGPIAQLEGQKAEDQIELVRRAIHLAREAALIDRPIESAFPRIEEDWRVGLLQPDELTFAAKAEGMLALRARGREGLDFLRAHDRLPPELAFTAGRHLDRAQLGWLLGKIESFRNRGHVRILRDLVLASIEAGRLDLLDAFVAGKVDQKTALANAELVAVEFRQGRLQELPIDLIVEKLGAGEDAIPAIQAQRRGDAVAVQGLDGIAATPAGAAELARWKTQLDTLINATPPENQVYADKGKNWRDPLMGAIGAIAAGDWPAWKAENEVGKRQLEGLTPEQIAIWMSDEVTGKPDPAQAQRADVQRAFTLLKGLKQALPEEIRLTGTGFEDVAWDQASLDRLRARQSQAIEALHAAERGSEAHRAASKEIGPLNRRIAVLELQLGLEGAIALDPVTALLDSKGLLAAAETAARRLGGRGSAEAIREIRDVASTIKLSPRDGRHAVDENTLEGFIQAFTGGCLRVGNGSNQVSLIEHIASAMYKIGRTVNGGATEARGFARLYRFSFPGYERAHGIQLDILRSSSGATNVPEEAKRILHQHMLAKAEAMGVPYLTSDDTALALANEKGLRVLKSQQVDFHVDHGHTGLHHAQNIDYATYWILWKHAHSYSNAIQEPDESLEATRTYTKHVILPRGVRLKDQA